jgi:hypothetical protein
MKVDYTLQDCINKFNAHVGGIMQPHCVRMMENISEWRTASEYWRKLGRESDANACDMIADATERGNAYREATAHLSDWVDKSVEMGMDKDDAIKVIYPEMNKIYNQHFGKSK